MNAYSITNSLLRIDGYAGAIPRAFEHPSESMEFAVLELGPHEDFARWRTDVEQALRAHTEFLRTVRASGSVATLFVELGQREPVLRFELSFLRLLADAGVSLECSYEAT